MIPESGKRKLRLIWAEAGGPHVTAPVQRGFGSRLITRVLKDDFNGTVELFYGPAGLRCRLTTPVKNIETAPN